MPLKEDKSIGLMGRGLKNKPPTQGILFEQGFTTLSLERERQGGIIKQKGEIYILYF